MLFKNAVETCHHILNTALKLGMTVVDATVGKGNDSLFIKQLIGDEGHLYGFDLDDRAIEVTRALLTSNGFSDHIYLFNSSHAKMSQLLSEPIDAVVFNLGYLPGLSKMYTTQSVSTLCAIEQALLLLTVGGFAVIVVYPGHPEGALESSQLKAFITGLDQKKYHLFEITYPNQVNQPPYLIYIEKRVL